MTSFVNACRDIVHQFGASLWEDFEPHVLSWRAVCVAFWRHPLYVLASAAVDNYVKLAVVLFLLALYCALWPWRAEIHRCHAWLCAAFFVAFYTEFFWRVAIWYWQK
jgi:hypothetical protein